MVIRVMTEVKVREDEYGLIKNFLSRIRGLPSEPQIATRERRLLFHGTLHLHTVDDEEVTILDNVLLPINSPQDYVPITQNGGANLPNRSSRLANAINKWDARRRRSESTSSSSTGTSFGTASSGASSDMPATPSSTFFSSFRIPVPDGRLNTARIPEQKRVLVSPSPNPRRPSVRGIPVQVFIFTDLVLLTTPNSSLTPENSSWTLLEDIGITRILAVSEYSEQDTSGLKTSLPTKLQTSRCFSRIRCFCCRYNSCRHQQVQPMHERRGRARRDSSFPYPNAPHSDAVWKALTPR